MLSLWPTKVPCVGLESTQTGLIWDCHKGQMVSEGAYGVEEGVGCSAAEPSQLVHLQGEPRSSLGKAARIPADSVGGFIIGARRLSSHCNLFTETVFPPKIGQKLKENRGCKGNLWK